MAEYGSPFSLSQLSNTSKDEFSDQNTINIIGDGANGWSYPHQTPPSSSIGHHYHYQALPLPQKKLRGRPTGSKNKPKPPIVITKDSDELLKPVIIEVSIGSDVVEALVDFARRRNVGISVLSGSGSIANVTLHHPHPSSPSFTLHGPFTLLALTGTYICSPFHPHPSFPLMDGSSYSAFKSNYPYSKTTNSFAISLLASHGEIFGGIVAGKLVAGSNVTVMVAVFKKPEFHKIGFNGNDEGGVGEEDHNPNATGNDNISSYLNPKVPYADVNMIQWGHINSSTCPRNH